MKPTPNAAKFIEFFDDVHRVQPRSIPTPSPQPLDLETILNLGVEAVDPDIQLRGKPNG